MADRKFTRSGARSSPPGGGNRIRTHPSRRGSRRVSADRQRGSESPPKRRKKTPADPTGIAPQQPLSNPKSTPNCKSQHPRSERHATENARELPSAPWDVFDDIFIQLGQAADACTVVVGCLESGNEDINGPDACALILDLHVDRVIREQAARIERIYTGKDSTSLVSEDVEPTMNPAGEASLKERLGNQTDLSEHDQTTKDEMRAIGAAKS